jgi:hypothetical protein
MFEGPAASAAGPFSFPSRLVRKPVECPHAMVAVDSVEFGGIHWSMSLQTFATVAHAISAQSHHPSDAFFCHHHSPHLAPL